MYSLLPILVFLATANAVAIDRTGAQAGAVEKRGCLVDPLGILGLCNGAAATSSSSSAKASSTSSSSSSSSSSKAATSSSTSVSVSVSSSSSVKPTTTTSVAQSSTSSAGNIVQTVAAVPVSVVSQVLTCPLDPLGVLGLCGNGNATPASSSAAQSTSTSKAAASASSSASASASTSTGNVVSSIIAVPSSVVSQAASIVNPVVSSAAAIPSAVVSSAASVVNPVVSSVSSAAALPSAAVSQAASIVNPVVSSAAAIPSAVVSSAASIVNPVVSSVSSVIAPSSAASSISSIIASVSASSAQASSSSSAVVSVAPTTTSTSTTPSATPSPSNAAVSGWKYANCVAEGTSGRALTGSTFAGSSMTVESCLASCDAAGFPLAGLEYSSECYCGSSLSNGASLSKTGTCAMTCSGNPSEICGGSATLSLYVSTKSNAAGLSSDLTTQTVALPAGWSSTTCMQEVSGRAFTKKSTASDDMTIQKCLAFCGDSKYAGLEYGRECYCADTLSNGASLSSTSGQCVTPCAGAASTTCGGPNALQVYTNSNFKASSSGAYTNTGCVQEVDGRLLRGASIAGDNMTIETCTNFCQSQGMSIAGLEYGRECYCGNQYVSTPLSSGQCNMPCAGNGAENCGGPNALNIFTLA